MSSRCILFDLDGTLTDPAEGITRSICYALEKMGRVAPEPSSLNWTIGPPLQASLASILESENADDSLRCLGYYRERFSDVGLFENAVYDGVIDMLSSLKQAGFTLYVATSKPGVYAAQIVEHFKLTGFFERIYGSELDGVRTDKADLLAFLLEKEGLRSEDCTMIGDREHDVRGALANGIPCVGALWGYGSREELQRAGACSLAGCPAEATTLFLQV